MGGDRKKGVTTITFRRPLQTNEPINDQPIPTDGYVSVIAAIGTINSRREANAHSHDGMNVNSEDIQINFSSLVSIRRHCQLFDCYENANKFPIGILFSIHRWTTIVKLH